MSEINELVEMSGLSESDIKFAEKYMETYCATTANKYAFPDKSPRYGARRLKGRAMSEYIQKRRAEQMEAICIDANRVLAEVAAMAFTDISDVVDWDSAQNSFSLKNKEDLTQAQRKSIKKISLKRTPLEHGDKVEISVEMHDKIKAISMLDKHLNILGDAKTLVQVNQQNNVSIEASDMTDEQLKNLISGQNVTETLGEITK